MKQAGYFCPNDSAYSKIFDQGWTHTNAVTRLANGHILISLRNFNFVAEVDAGGSVVNIIGRGIFRAQHDPEVQPNGNILITGFTWLLKFTPGGELVWRLNLNGVFTDRRQAPVLGFYKAERVVPRLP